MSLYRDTYCADVVELLSDYLEGAIDQTERERLERHLASCPGCEGYLDQLRRTIRITGRLRERDVGPEAMDDLLHVFSRWRAEAERG